MALLLPTTSRHASSSLLPSGALRTSYICQQCRHATLIRRPKRPYQFTQLVVLSDGSAYMHRTTSPAPVYTAAKDTRNHPLWNPTSARLANLESDDAGRLRAFRARFGRGWDAKSAVEVPRAEDLEEEEDEDGEEGEGKEEEEEEEEEEDNLMDLISAGFEKAEGEGPKKGKDGEARAPKKGGKKK